MIALVGGLVVVVLVVVGGKRRMDGRGGGGRGGGGGRCADGSGIKIGLLSTFLGGVFRKC